MTGGAEAGEGWRACVLASLLEERDVLRGRPDDVPTDVAERVILVADPDSRHPRADPGALRAANRRAAELARRAGLQARCGGRRPMRPGAGAGLSRPAGPGPRRGPLPPPHRRRRLALLGDPLAGEAFLAVAEVEPSRGGRRYPPRRRVSTSPTWKRWRGRPSRS